MLTTRIYPGNEAQLDKPNLTNSYVETLWRHGKQLLKGTAVLGAAMLGYSAWRSWASQTPPLLRIDNAVTKLPADTTSYDNGIENILPISYHHDGEKTQTAQQLANNLDITYQASRTKRRVNVNQCIPGWQSFNSQAQIAGSAFSDGDYVMAWTGNDGYIYAQRYAADGSVLGNELSVSTNQVDIHNAPVVAVLSNDNFVVAWPVTSAATSAGYNIYAQIYDPLGNQLNSQFRVVSFYKGPYSKDFPVIAALPDGSFVVVFSDYIAPFDQMCINHYSTAGILLNLYTDGNRGGTVVGQSHFVATGLSNGNFAAAWASPSFGGKTYAPTRPIEPPFVVANNISYPVITGMMNGNFVIAWISEQNVYANFFLQPATVVSNFKVNTSPGNKNQPGITTLSNGDFVISWQSNNHVYIQRYSVSSTNSSVQLGPELLLFNTPAAYTGVTLYTPMFTLPNGDFFVMWQNWAQRVYQKLTIAHACDQFYTENSPKPLGLAVSALSYAFNQTTIAVQLLNMTAGQLNSLQTTSGTASASYNATIGLWFGAGANVADLNALLSTLQFMPALNYHANVTISVNAQDNLDNTFQSSFMLKGIAVDYPPTWINNQLIINQGEALALTRNNLQVYDVDKLDSEIGITVISAQYGQFEFKAQPGIPITTFNQQQIDTEIIVFLHNGLAFAPSYALIATDGIFTTPVSIANINFDLSPNIIINVLGITTRGQTVTFTSSQILAVDDDNLSHQLLFTASNIAHGHFEVTTYPGEAITTFSQLYIDSGLIKFIHDGSDQSPRYTLTVNDGRMSSAPSEVVVTFNPEAPIPFTETTGFKSGISIAITAGGTLLGFAAWRYRNDQDAKRRRQQSLIANIIRADLNLAGVHDFTSERGAQLLEAISSIIKQLDKLEIDVIRMTVKEQENFAHKLAACLKVYVSHTPPNDILEGNIVTQPTRHLYYQKIKPLIKSGVGWLDTDAIKKAADVIAENVKVKLNEQEQDIESGSTNTKGNKSSVMMQPLLSHN